MHHFALRHRDDLSRRIATVQRQIRLQEYDVEIVMSSESQQVRMLVMCEDSLSWSYCRDEMTGKSNQEQTLYSVYSKQKRTHVI